MLPKDFCKACENASLKYAGCAPTSQGAVQIDLEDIGWPRRWHHGSARDRDSANGCGRRATFPTGWRARLRRRFQSAPAP